GDEIGEPDARLRAAIRHDPVIAIDAQAGLELQVAELDRVLNVEGVLIDVFALVEVKRCATGTCQVVRDQLREKLSAFIQERAVCRIGDTERELLMKTRLHHLRPDFKIVAALDNGQIPLYTPIRKRPMLADGGGPVVGENRAGVIIHPVSPVERVDREKRAGAEYVLIAGRKVESGDFLALVLSQLVVGIRGLEPVAGAEDVQVEGILPGGIEIEMVEDSAAVSDIVDGLKFRRIQETPGPERIKGHDIAPLAPAPPEWALLGVVGKRTALQFEAPE